MTRIRVKIYHKPIEPLHRPFEAVAEEAKARVRNTCFSTQMTTAHPIPARSPPRRWHQARSAFRSKLAAWRLFFIQTITENRVTRNRSVPNHANCCAPHRLVGTLYASLLKWYGILPAWTTTRSA